MPHVRRSPRTNRHTYALIALLSGECLDCFADPIDCKWHCSALRFIRRGFRFAVFTQTGIAIQAPNLICLQVCCIR